MKKHYLQANLNVDEPECYLKSFCFQYIGKDKTCFKTIDNPSSIDLFFLTNSPKSYQHTTMSTGLSDCHKLIITVLKSTFRKGKGKEITYRN